MRRRRVGPPIHPNAGIEVAYRKRLDRLIDQMNASILYWLTARWRVNPPTSMGMDEQPWFGSLQRTMRQLISRWETKFDELAPELAAYFAESVTERPTGRLTQILDDAGFTVDFKLTPAVRTAMGAIVQENVSLIKSIAREHLTDVEGIVYRSVSAGGDLETLAKSLRQRFDVPKKRAAFIAHHQNNAATAAITRIRQSEAGITSAVWMHSHAGKTPRPEHVAFAAGQMGGPVYDVNKGAYLEGVWTWPGREPGCRCFSRPVLEGF